MIYFFVIHNTLTDSCFCNTSGGGPNQVFDVNFINNDETENQNIVPSVHKCLKMSRALKVFRFDICNWQNN